MSDRQIGQVNQQSKGETPLVSGILQRAAVRSIADQEVEASKDVESEKLKESRFQHDFSQLPIRGGLPIQAKLTIGAVGDKYEQEADRVAQEVVSRINTPASAQSTQGQSAQRQEEADEELQAKPEITALQRQEEPDEELQAKPSISNLQRSPLSPEVQREAMPEEEELQAKSTLQPGEENAGGEASTDLTSAINSATGSGQPLEAGLQHSMGLAMGTDFSGVRVHTDTQSDQLNRSIQAKAFTTGKDVFFRQGAYEPGSRGGQELIAHELTHVLQQNQTTAPRLQRASSGVKVGYVDAQPPLNTPISVEITGSFLVDSQQKIQAPGGQQGPLEARHIVPNSLITRSVAAEFNNKPVSYFINQPQFNAGHPKGFREAVKDFIVSVLVYRNNRLNKDIDFLSPSFLPSPTPGITSASADRRNYWLGQKDENQFINHEVSRLRGIVDAYWIAGKFGNNPATIDENSADYKEYKKTTDEINLHWLTLEFDPPPGKSKAEYQQMAEAWAGFTEDWFTNDALARQKYCPSPYIQTRKIPWLKVYQVQSINVGKWQLAS